MFLQEAKNLQQVKQVIALADAARVYGKQIGATIETQNYAAEIRLRAERRLGEMLKIAPKQHGARSRKGGGTRGSKKELQVQATPTLSSVGITKKESSRSQELAEVPEAEFEAALVVEAGKELNHNRVLKHAKETRQRNARQSKRTAAAAGAVLDQRIHVGDFRELADKVPDGSVNLIFTDPPYDRNASLMLPALGKFAAAKLAEGGSMICYVGQTQLPTALDAFRLHLRYWWTISCVHGGGKTVMREYGINAGWKPVLWFVKGTRDDNSVMVNDVMSGGQEKDHHKWQQSESEAAYWIEKLCPVGGLVCDPFMGSGTTAVAAQKLARSWVGFEIDKDTAKAASRRIG
jgi:16S rRNA G966 N2-methylase RsmD